jgi:hypothetical protein
MKTARVPILALFAAVAAVSPSPARADIIVAAQEIEVTVTPRAARLRLVNLPALELGLRAAIRCNGDAVSLTLSVADTFRTLARDELAGKRSAEVVLTVPAAQLALAASSGFCIAGDDESADELLVPGFATAHASLRCEDAGARSMHFASAPLKVRILCAREPVEPQEPPDSASPAR